MPTPVYRYALDKTGLNPDNLVVREEHQLKPKVNQTDVRVTSPLYGPFFAESIVILDASNGRELGRDEYKVTDLLSNPTLNFGKEIGQFVVITNGLVSNEIEISYQVLGGNYQNDSTSVQHVFETFLNDTRPVDWSNISGRPSTFPPTLHLHLLQDIINFGPLVVAIDSLRQAMLLNNTPMFEALIDFVTNRTTDWSEITNIPNTLAGYGISDAVDLNSDQTIIGVKSFGIVNVGRGSTAISEDLFDESPIATVAHLTRTAEKLVPKTTKVIAGKGMTGGGNLTQDTTITLGNPLTITSTSANEVTLEGHSHEIDISAITPVRKWKDMAGKRLNNVPYKNENPYDIEVSAGNARVGHENGVSGYVDGVLTGGCAVNPDGRAYLSINFTVPPGATYQVYATSGLRFWSELS